MAVTGKALVQGAVNTANEQLLDRAVRHAVRLERLKTGEAREILRFLDRKVFPDAVEKLAAGLQKIKGRGMATVRTKQVRNLVASLQKLLNKGLGDARKISARRLEKIGITEAEWQKALIDEFVGPVGFNTTLPSVSFIRTVVNSQPFRGELLSDWFKKLSARAQTDVRANLRIGLVEGESIPELTRRIQGTTGFEMTRRNATAIVRTATNHVTTQAREAVYRANDDVVKAVEWVSTLDVRTTEICMSLDTKVYPIDEGPRPPAHMQCRSTTVPVLKSFKELGIDLKEPPPGARAARRYTEAGKALRGEVPAKTTYGQWLKRQPAPIQNEALGPTRARLFREGKVKVDRFVDDQQRPLTLEQLREREGLSAKDIAVNRGRAGSATR